MPYNNSTPTKNLQNKSAIHHLSPTHPPSANHSQSPIRLFLKKIRKVESKIQEIQDRITGIQKKISFSSPSHLNINDVSEKIEVLYNKATEILGKGANGEVKKVEIRGKNYAVKKFKSGPSDQNQLKNNEWIRSKDIPYLLNMYGTVSIQDGYSYSIMEYLNKDEWKSLNEIKNEKKYDCDKICSKLKEAIQFVHEEDFCLLDIKPENILIKYETLNEPNVELKFIDYGSSIYEFKQINEMLGYTPVYKLPDYRSSYENIEKNKEYAKYRDLFAIHVVCIFLKDYDNFFRPLYIYLDNIRGGYAGLIRIIIIYKNLLYLLNEIGPYIPITIQKLRYDPKEELKKYLISFEIKEGKILKETQTQTQKQEIKNLLEKIFLTFYQQFKNSEFTKDPFKSLFK